MNKAAQIPYWFYLIGLCCRWGDGLFLMILKILIDHGNASNEAGNLPGEAFDR